MQAYQLFSYGIFSGLVFKRNASMLSHVRPCNDTLSTPCALIFPIRRPSFRWAASIQWPITENDNDKNLEKNADDFSPNDSYNVSSVESTSRYPRKGEELEVICETLASKGMGVCRLPESGYVILCERALPGERLVARITKRKRGYAEAYKVSTLAPHWDKVEPPCIHFHSCGGCSLQNLAYSAQLAVKQQQVQDIMVRMAALPESRMAQVFKPIVPCDEQYHYRNKMEFSFGSRVWHVEKPPASALKAAPVAVLDSEWGSPAPAIAPASAIDQSSVTVDSVPVLPEVSGTKRGGKGRRTKSVPANPNEFALGLHAPKRFDKILPISHCLLQHDLANTVLDIVRLFCESRRESLPAYDAITHQGVMRHLVIRTGSDHSQLPPASTLSVNLVTKTPVTSLLLPLAAQILEAVPQVVSIVHTVNPTLSDSWAFALSSSPSASSSPGDGEGGDTVTARVLHGPAFILERVCGLEFEISAASFFQTNSRQAERLYQLVHRACLEGLPVEAHGRKPVLLDLFCGTGTIGLSMADKVSHVYGYEIVPSAVADAERNMRRNNIANASFIVGDLNKLSDSFGADFPPPDIVVADPNRPGLHSKLISFLRQSACSRFVYVSCNPATCARDIALLTREASSAAERPFCLQSVQPVDMFPQTMHVECVAVLDRQPSPQ